MNGLQKIIKILAICFAIFLIVNIVGGILFGMSILTNITSKEDKQTVQTFSEIYKDVNKIDINSIGANLTIKAGDEFKVESNNIKNNFTSKIINGNLKIEEHKTWPWSNIWSWEDNSYGEIIVYIPKEKVLDKLEIDSGAGKIQIEDATVEDFDIDQGAGVLTIKNSKFNKTDIDGGAGEIVVTSTVLNNLKMSAGIGKITLNAEITGKSKIECGVGEVEIELIGDENKYRISAEKGIGNIEINNQQYVSNTVYGRGENDIKIEGGVGNITVKMSQM